MCLAQGPQRSDAGEAQTRGPSGSSQALWHRATVLPYILLTIYNSFVLCYIDLFFLFKQLFVFMA